MLNILAGGMLVLAFFTVARMRLRSMLYMFAGQSLLMAAFAAVAAASLHEEHLYITAALTLALKVWFLPWFLVRTAERSGSVQRLHAYLRPATALFIGFFMVVGAFLFTRPLAPFTNSDYFLIAVSVSVVLLGLLMLVARKGMYGQIVGFLQLESGIFIFGLSLTGGMPLLVEIGIFFDVTIGSILMAALSYRAQKEHETVLTDRLSELVD